MSKVVETSPHCKATGRHKLHLRQGVYYYRQKIPQDLLPWFNGHLEIKKSLKTRHHQQAHNSFAIWEAKTDRLFVGVRCLLEVAPRSELTRKQIDGMVQGCLQNINQDTEEVSPTPIRRQREQRPKTPPRKKTKLLSEVMALRIKELEARHKASKTIADAKSIYALLLRVLGDRDIASFTYEDILDASEKMKKLPKGASTDPRLKILPIDDVLRLATDRMQRYAEKTVHNHLTNINTLFNYCVDKHWISRSPCPRWEKSKALKRATGYQPFDQDDLKRLFAAPFHTDPAIRMKHPQNYWVPLIALYSGLRLDEVCQLYKEDIVEVDGIACFSVNPDKDKKVKSDTSIRLIPIHSVLIKLGLLDYAGGLNADRLWPQLKKGANGYSHEFSKMFGGYKRKYLTMDRTKVFHSLRKTFANTLAERGLSDEITGAVLGHSPVNLTTRIYTGMKNIKILKNAIEMYGNDILIL